MKIKLKMNLDNREDFFGILGKTTKLIFLKETIIFCTCKMIL